MTRMALVGLTLVSVATALGLSACSDRGHEAGGTKRAPARTVLYYRDPMHPSYTSDVPGKAPDCGMDLEPVYADTVDPSGTDFRAASPGAISVTDEGQRLMGLRLGRVERSRTTGTVRTLGRVAFDENRVFPVRTGCDGWVTRIFPGAATGDAVRRGQSLASVYGRDFTTAQRSFL